MAHNISGVNRFARVLFLASRFSLRSVILRMF